MKNTKKIISIEKLHPFENHPYKVQDNEEMERLAESIQQNGVVSPIIVRPKENTADEYEIISVIDGLWLAERQGLQKSLP